MERQILQIFPQTDAELWQRNQSCVRIWSTHRHIHTQHTFFFFIFTTLNFLLFTNLVLPLHVFMSLLFFGLGSKPPDKTFTLTSMSTVVFEIAPLNFNSHVSFVVAFSLNMIIIDSGFQCSYVCDRRWTHAAAVGRQSWTQRAVVSEG